MKRNDWDYFIEDNNDKINFTLKMMIMLSSKQIEALRENLKGITTLREQITETRNNRSASLRYLLEAFRDKLIFTDHGERDRFFVPKHVALQRIEEFDDISDDKLNAAFTTNKTKLLSIVNRYLKDMLRGFLEHDLETVSTPQD